MDFMRGEDASPNPKAERKEWEIEVLRCNLRVLRVYRSCQLQFVPGGFGSRALGISATESRAALILHEVPRARWRTLGRWLRDMGAAAADWLNEEARKAAERAKSRG